MNFNISPTAFFQPNTQQAEKFYAKALELAEISEESIVFDLYCGTGTLGMAAAQKAKKVVGIELSKESSLDARENVKDNKIENMEVITGDVGKTLTELKSREDFSRPNLVIVDPPRAGLDDKAIKNLLELLPEKILYISCNPKTQQENLKQLLPHYKIEVVQPVDQFPHTLHMENIVLLSHVDKIR